MGPMHQRGFDPSNNKTLVEKFKQMVKQIAIVKT